jgi:hypothetical protein
MTREEKREWAAERRKTAIHEAGHVVIANALGSPATGTIWPSILTCNSGVVIRGFEGSRHSGRWKNSLQIQRRVGVAGAVAEHCWNEAIDGYYAESDFGDIYEMMSWSDRKTGQKFDGPYEQRSAGHVIDLNHSTLREEITWRNATAWVYKQINSCTGKLWPELLREARVMIVESRGVEPVDDTMP